MKFWYFRFLHTPLGRMQAIADSQAIYFLGFTDQKYFEKQIIQVVGLGIVIENMHGHAVLDLLQKELETYFAGELRQFTVPVILQGSDFQNQTWQALQTIMYGQTQSYAQLAHKIKKIHGHRAVANANSKNKIAIIIPCHRVILSDGKLGGYAGSVHRKLWLLEHEKTMNMQK